jgi:hypothetical protein
MLLLLIAVMTLMVMVISTMAMIETEVARGTPEKMKAKPPAVVLPPLSPSRAGRITTLRPIS